MSDIFRHFYVAARQGFEPQYADPKSAVLPLDDRANSKGLCYFTRKFDKRECSTLDYCMNTLGLQSDGYS